MSEGLFAPAGGWRVRIRDLSGGAEDGIVEMIGGFPTLMQANAFARRYVRDSLDRCRAPGMDARAVLAAWFAFGEDADVLDASEIAPDGAWRSATELDSFAARRGTPEEHDWRALDPRLDPPDDDEADAPA